MWKIQKVVECRYFLQEQGGLSKTILNLVRKLKCEKNQNMKLKQYTALPSQKELSPNL